MIRPHRARSMRLAARLATRKAPVRLASRTRVKSSSFIMQQEGVGVRPGGVDQDLDRPELLLDRGEGGVDRLGVGDVARTGKQPGFVGSLGCR